MTDVLGNMEVPEAAREFVQRATSTAKDRAADAQAGVERVTAAIENAAATSVSEAAKVSRAIQNTVYEEVDAALDGIYKLAAARSLGEVFRLQADYFHGRTTAMATRARAVGGYLSELAHQAAQFANRASAEGTQAV